MAGTVRVRGEVGERGIEDDFVVFMPDQLQGWSYRPLRGEGWGAAGFGGETRSSGLACRDGDVHRIQEAVLTRQLDIHLGSGAGLAGATWESLVYERS